MSGLDFIRSKEQKEAKSRDYLEMVFPFGLEQRDVINELINELFPKHPQGTVLFNYIVAKEYYIKNKKDNGENRAIKQLRRVRPRLKTQDLSRLFALLIADINASNLRSIPNRQKLEDLSLTYLEKF